ncbi:MAG: hypothetical protein IPM69_12455 [Ignavibacteria bacterium]|nr:hypothetical protein [Ignavibacteria bacterium]
MILEYPTEYRDSKGIEKSTFITDGKSLKIKLRSIEFEGHFWDLRPLSQNNVRIKELFVIQDQDILQPIYNKDGSFRAYVSYYAGSLTEYSLKIQMPIKVIMHNDKEANALIEFELFPGELYFVFEGNRYNFERPNFEYGLSPEFTTSFNIKYIKCCTNCKYSEYDPFGNDDYGDLMCFKNSKEEWSKLGYIALKHMSNQNWYKDLNVEKTQEAFWCDEFALKE